MTIIVFDVEALDDKAPQLYFLMDPLKLAPL
jgi:hypothetical protein